MEAAGSRMERESILLMSMRVRDDVDRACTYAMAKPELPSFIVVGPPRTGTTWLHDVLSSHANLPTPTKETRFFDIHFHRGVGWYHSHFLACQCGRPMGEVAPTYFASSDARKRIAATIPQAKLVFVFRNPIQRVISLYRIKRAYGILPWSFEEALNNDPELISSGMYSTHLAEWQRAFPAKQMLITIYEDMRNDPQLFVERVANFVGIRDVALQDAQLRIVHSSERLTEPRWFLATRTATAFADWCKARRLDNIVASVRESSVIKLFLGGGTPFPEVSPAAVRKLSEVFRPEVEHLEALLGRDLPSWRWAE